MLSPDEEEIVLECLDKISEQVRKYNLSLFPFFKDFDRVKLKKHKQYNLDYFYYDYFMIVE